MSEKVLRVSEGGEVIVRTDVQQSATMTMLADEGQVIEVDGWVLAPSATLHVGEESTAAVFCASGGGMSIAVRSTGDVRAYATMAHQVHHRCIVELHSALEAQRAEGHSPSVLVVGSTQWSGKSSLVWTLHNYAVRCGSQPVVVGANLRGAEHAVPECITVTCPQTMVETTGGRQHLPSLHFFVGMTNAASNVALFRHCLTSAHEVIAQKLDGSPLSQKGGVIFDFPTVDMTEVEAVEAEAAAMLRDEDAQSALERSPLSAIRAVIEALRVDTICIVGAEVFRHRLVRHLQATFEGGLLALPNGSKVRVVHFDGKSTSYPRGETDMRRNWMRYFFGSPQSPLQPRATEILLTEITVVRVGMTSAHAFEALMPMDREAHDAAGLRYLNNKDELRLHRLLAVSTALTTVCVSMDPFAKDAVYEEVERRKFEEEARRCEVLGFVLVVTVGATTARLLCPSGRLPQPRGIVLFPCESALSQTA